MTCAHAVFYNQLLFAVTATKSGTNAGAWRVHMQLGLFDFGHRDPAIKVFAYANSQSHPSQTVVMAV